jgi:hypothetical protein
MSSDTKNIYGPFRNQPSSSLLWGVNGLGATDWGRFFLVPSGTFNGTAPSFTQTKRHKLKLCKGCAGFPAFPEGGGHRSPVRRPRFGTTSGTNV